MIQAFLILTTLFLQEQAILPNTLSGAQNNTAEIERLASLVQSGWGMDPLTKKFVFTIQIPPESLAAFTAGRFGNDLGAPIPPDIRPFVEEVIIRIGTGTLPRTAPTPEMRAAITRNAPPMMTMLDDRNSLSDIDPVLPAAGQGGLGNSGMGNPGSGSGSILPPGMSPNGNDAPSLLGNSGTRQPSPLPPVTNSGIVPPSGLALSGAPTGNGSTFQNPTSPNPAMPNPSSTNMGRTDGFRADSNAGSMLGRLTGGTQPLPSTNPTTGAGSLSPPYASSSPAVPHVASNPLPNQNGTNYGAPVGYNQPNTPSSNPGASQGYGLPLLQPAPYDPRLASAVPAPLSNPAGTGLPPNPAAQNLGNPNAGNLPNANGIPSSVLSPADTQPGVTFDKLLPLITLMLLVINIYQFFWMAHVRTRYKEMVISKRTAQLNLSNT
ncbi:hypothetical protein VN12_12540 [Pirellula sp. SH-Sr6A]|uniref:hypothetical protein n=1 Tax=Pirellula sp. SH-Sr6A TaxID=1632865 RepID=UPI00078B5729|nr:hypothetical protein [Pirellula sp. SH-Sr6A]AMV32948.1 hypothetical protein VN12_12540 [Pirellula sp. SH-Sr6A]